MTLPGADESLLRRYLLGTVTDAARKDLETRLFSEDRIFWERISIAEDDSTDVALLEPDSVVAEKVNGRYDQHDAMLTC